jgi:hypothetical protein
MTNHAIQVPAASRTVRVSGAARLIDVDFMDPVIAVQPEDRSLVVASGDYVIDVPGGSDVGPWS